MFSYYYLCCLNYSMSIMKFQAMLITISSFHFVLSEIAWRQMEGGEIEYSDTNEFQEDLFNDIPPKTVFSKNEKKEISGPKITDMKKSKKEEIYQSGRSITPCSCFLKYDLQKLGRLYFPRNILTMVCDNSACGSVYQCNQKKYGVRVLKKKTPAERISSVSSTLSGSLDYQWISEIKYVTVACECSEM